VRKLLLWVLCVGVALVLSPSAHARGGTYHHKDPVFIPPDKHKTHRHVPVVQYSPEHRHYHLTYHPQ
jgi:hypothetical protein